MFFLLISNPKVNIEYFFKILKEYIILYIKFFKMNKIIKFYVFIFLSLKLKRNERIKKKRIRQT